MPMSEYELVGWAVMVSDRGGGSYDVYPTEKIARLELELKREKYPMLGRWTLRQCYLGPEET